MESIHQVPPSLKETEHGRTSLHCRYGLGSAVCRCWTQQYSSAVSYDFPKNFLVCIWKDFIGVGILRKPEIIHSVLEVYKIVLLYCVKEGWIALRTCLSLLSQAAKLLPVAQR